VKRVLFFIIFLFSFALSQQHFNHLKVNGVLRDDIGPFYFIDYGNNHDAYVLAKDFATALGLEYQQNISQNLVTFSANGKTVSIKTTSNIPDGLIKRPDSISIPNKTINSPMAIIVDNKVYTAITPILYAFGGDSPYNPEEHTLYSSLKLSDSSTAPIKTTATVKTATSTAPAQASMVSAPRLGKQENGSTRVVFDLPIGTKYNISVSDNSLIVAFAGLKTYSFDNIPKNDPNIIRIQSGNINGQDVIIINPSYSIAQDSGYKYGFIPAQDSNSKDRLYIDFHAKNATLVGVTPQAAEPTTPTATVINSKKVVVIDAGHGGKDPGASSSYAVESKIVLKVALYLRDILEAQGVEVILTRDNDRFLKLQERSEFAKPDINLFISIHANSISNSAANGIETWVFGEPLDGRLIALAITENGGGEQGQALTQEALNYAKSIPAKIYKEEQLRYSLALANSVQQEVTKISGAKNRGVRENAFYVIRKARTPAILVEIGFLSNPTEGSNLTTDSYQEKIAEGLANGILKFMNNGGLGE